MDPNKTSIVQITRSDIKELAELTHIIAGDGLKLSRENGHVIISIDTDKLRAMLGTL